MRRLPIAWTLLTCLACKSTPAPAPAPATEDTVADRDPVAACRLVKVEGALLIDARTPGEFEAGHLDGAMLVPHDQTAARTDEILEAQGGDRTKPIVVYCGSGRRAGLAKQTLVDAGFTRVTNLGGIGDWPDDCD